jgi:hypothetical protein
MSRHFTLLAAAVIVAACAFVTGGSGAFAHSATETTVPADGAILQEPPERVAMEFDGPMRITVIRLLSDGGPIDFEETSGTDAVTRYEATPPTLGPGTYEVEWRGLAEDGHPMHGSFGFTVE